MGRVASPPPNTSNASANDTIFLGRPRTLRSTRHPLSWTIPLLALTAVIDEAKDDPLRRAAAAEEEEEVVVEEDEERDVGAFA